MEWSLWLMWIQVLLSAVTFAGALQIENCDFETIIRITNDVASPSDITCSGLQPTDSVKWSIQNPSSTTSYVVATCTETFCTSTNVTADVQASRSQNSVTSTLRIISNPNLFNDALVSCQVSNIVGSEPTSCKIKVIDPVPAPTITIDDSSTRYAGGNATLRCRSSLAVTSLPLTYVWSGVNGADVTIVGNVCQFNKLRAEDNRREVGCTVRYTSYLNIPGKNIPVTLNVKYPPPSPPVITATSNTGALSLGQSVTLECRVYSGNPLVTSVSFYCGQHGDVADTKHEANTDATSYVSSDVTIQSVQASDAVTCQCNAVWESSDMYTNNSASVTLTVTGTSQPSPTTVSQTPSSSSSLTSSETTVGGAEANTGEANVGAIVGGVIGAVVAIAIVVVVVFFIIKRRKSRPKPPSTSRRDDTEDHINPVYGTDDPSSPNTTTHNPPSSSNGIYSGVGDDEVPESSYVIPDSGVETPEAGYAAVDIRGGRHPSTKPTAVVSAYEPVNEGKGAGKPPTHPKSYGGSSDYYSTVGGAAAGVNLMQPPAMAASDEYAVVDKPKKSKKKGALHAQIPLDAEYAVVNKTMKTQSTAATAHPQDEYAVVDKSRKSQPAAAASGDEYAVVDKSRAKPAAKPKPEVKPKPTQSSATKPDDDQYNALNFQASQRAPHDVEQNYSHLDDATSDADSQNSHL